jgi:hypothetical protein
VRNYTATIAQASICQHSLDCAQVFQAALFSERYVHLLQAEPADWYVSVRDASPERCNVWGRDATVCQSPLPTSYNWTKVEQRAFDMARQLATMTQSVARLYLHNYMEQLLRMTLPLHHVAMAVRDCFLR